MQNHIFLFFQFRRDETFIICECLLADITPFFSDILCLQLGNLNVIAIDLVVTDLQCTESRTFTLGCFQGCDEFLSMALYGAHFVKLFIIAIPEHTAFTGCQCRFIIECVLQFSIQILQGINTDNF